MLSRLLLPAGVIAALAGTAVQAQTGAGTTGIPASSRSGMTLTGPNRFRVTPQQLPPRVSQRSTRNTAFTTAGNVVGPIASNGQSFFFVRGIGFVPASTANAAILRNTGLSAQQIATLRANAVNSAALNAALARQFAANQNTALQFRNGFNTGFVNTPVPSFGALPPVDPGFGTTPAIPIPAVPGGTVDPRNPGIVVDPRFTDPRFAQGFNTVTPGTGFVPGTTVTGVDPVTGLPFGATAGVPAGVGFVPGNGVGFFDPGFGFGPSGPINAAPSSMGGPVIATGRAFPLMGVPTAGMNAPALGRAFGGSNFANAGRARTVRMSGNLAGPRMASDSGLTADARRVRDRIIASNRGGISERVAGARIEMRSDSINRVAADDPAQISLASHAEDIMEDRPMREGRITDVGATKVSVYFVDNGKPKTLSLPVNQVFFFREDGRMETVATAPSMAESGTRVLFAEPRSRDSRTSVAEFETERRINGETSDRMDTAGTPIQDKVAGYRQSTTIKSKVAGQRQTIRRRPAK